MKQILKTLKAAIICFAFMTVLCGILYPGLVTGVAQTVFPKQANGSIISVVQSDGTKKDIGSNFIAQEFTNPKYLIGRPMAVSNLSPVSIEQKKLIAKRVKWWHAIDPTNQEPIPLDLVTASGSGFDPNISVAAADYQVARIAKIRGMDEDAVKAIIKKCTQKRLLGFWGEPAVNVLKVNILLDGLKQR